MSDDRPAGRLFLAVALTDDARHGLAARLAAALADGVPGRAVGPGSWHLTLRFLGAVTEPRRDLLLAILDEAVDQGPFTVRLGGLGAFPRPTSATVLWVGVEDREGAIARIAATCEEAARRIGLDPEERPFHPHVTLARIRPPRSVSSLVDEVDDIGVRLVVDHVTLYRSRLGGRGPARYEIVDTIPLVGRRPARPGYDRSEPSGVET